MAFRHVVNSNDIISKLSHNSVAIRRPPNYWNNKDNVVHFLEELKKKHNLNSFDDWNSITHKEIQNQGGNVLLSKYSMYELKCIGYPKGKIKFDKTSIYWNDKQNILQFLEELRQKYNFNSPEDWNNLTKKIIQSNGGNILLKQYSLIELKCLACPEGESYFNKNINKKEELNNNKIKTFLKKLKEKFNLQSFDDWNSISTKQIISNGGRSLLNKYSLYNLKCIGFPEGKYLFEKTKSIQKSSTFWNDKNIYQFLDNIKDKYNLQSIDDWNSITQKQIQFNGGSRLLQQYSLFDLKCLACPHGKFKFNKPVGFWDDKENVLQFLNDLRIKYNLNSFEDWNSMNQKYIQDNGGSSLLNKYSIYDLKCLAFPEGKLQFDKHKSSSFWDNKKVDQFLNNLKEKYNLQTFEDWNSVSSKLIQDNNGSSLLRKYSLFDLKCMAFPSGKLLFDKPLPSKPAGFWDDTQNILQFLEDIKEKYKLQSPEDWNSITQKQIRLHGGSRLLSKYSMFELKCLACPEGKSFFDKPTQSKGYWSDKQNVLQFLDFLKEKYNLQSIDDWNSITTTQIQSNGGGSLLNSFSMYDLKCMAYPEGKSVFDKRTLSEYWNDEENRNQFIEKLKIKFDLKTPQDWQRLSSAQIKLQGGFWLFYNNMEFLKKTIITFESSDETYSLKELLEANHKRSSQRWLFLQVQKLFPHEEIVEDYYHSEISRETGYSVQFDVFLINKKIAIEYHGKQHYEDIPSTFAPLEMLQSRDIEKEKLCSKYDIQLIVIPYWWDNKLESLKETLNSIIKM